MKYSIYLKSGNIIHGVNQEAFETIKKNSLERYETHATHIYEWLSNGMFETTAIEAIIPEDEKVV